jgi:uncharacterized BrkB/YihY/UPF0761 family membrane protein
LPQRATGSHGGQQAGVVAMNRMERAIRRADVTQQRFTPSAFVFGIVKKYGDDNGGVLAASLAYSGFISLFPLLLVLVTVVGLAASADASFRQQMVDAVAGQVPLIGHQLTGNVHALQRSSVIGLVIGLAGVIGGATGLAQSGLFAMAQAWNRPGPATCSASAGRWRSWGCWAAGSSSPPCWPA